MIFIGLIIGFICGTFTGIIVTAINMASKRADELMEDHQNEKIDR